VNLGSLGGIAGSSASAINNLGEVTGTSDLAGDATYHAFLWRKGVMTDLGTLPGDFSSYGSAINNRGQIVGGSCDIDGNCRQVLWENGVMTELNTLTPADSTLSILDAVTINDAGEIVGYAYDQATGNTPAFLALVSSGGDNSSAEGVRDDTKVKVPDSISKTAQQRLQRRRMGLPPARYR
jgi:probable HAF family extracellular repeat protein